MTVMQGRSQPARTAYVPRRNPPRSRSVPASPPPSNTAPPKPPGIVTRGFINMDQYLFAIMLAAKTGLDPRVIIAWERAEEPANSSPTERGHNWLNVGVGSPGGPKGAGYGWSGIRLAGTGNPGYTFSNVNDATTETAYWINHMSNFSGIKSSAKSGASTQIAAIVASPWDAGHYGGSARGLTSLYNLEDPGGGSNPLGDVGGWLKSAGSGALSIGGDVAQGALGGALGVGGGLFGGTLATANFLSGLTDTRLWIRIGFVIVGLGFGFAGLVFLFLSTNVGKSAVAAAPSAAIAAA